MKVTAGTHVLGNLFGCSRELLEKVDVLRVIMRKVVKEAKLKPVGETFHQFKPHGATGVILLAESHFSIHTWPEDNFAAVDIFCCGNEGDPEPAFDILCKYMKPKDVNKKVVKR